MDDKKFWQTVNVTDDENECWEWQGAIKGRYGYLQEDGKAISSHRRAYELCFGGIVEDVIMHSCDNRLCCNPLHLVMGYQLDNIRDMFSKGRNGIGGNKIIGSSCSSAKLTESDIPEIFGLYNEENKSMAEIGRIFGVARTTMNRVIKGETWKHVPREPIKRHPRKE